MKGKIKMKKMLLVFGTLIMLSKGAVYPQNDRDLLFIASYRKIL
jgi:hypothetical protein